MCYENQCIEKNGEYERTNILSKLKDVSVDDYSLPK